MDALLSAKRFYGVVVLSVKVSVLEITVAVVEAV